MGDRETPHPRDYNLDALAEFYETAEVETLVTDAASRMAEQIAERMEYELRGAWRAGYDYVHVYAEIPSHRPGGGGEFMCRQYIFPAHSKQPPKPDGLNYGFTYDLSSVPDHVIRQAIRDAGP